MTKNRLFGAAVRKARNLPTLKKYGISATLFVKSRFIDGKSLRDIVSSFGVSNRQTISELGNEVADFIKHKNYALISKHESEFSLQGYTVFKNMSEIDTILIKHMFFKNSFLRGQLCFSRENISAAVTKFILTTGLPCPLSEISAPAGIPGAAIKFVQESGDIDIFNKNIVSLNSLHDYENIGLFIKRLSQPSFQGTSIRSLLNTLHSSGLNISPKNLRQVLHQHELFVRVGYSSYSLSQFLKSSDGDNSLNKVDKCQHSSQTKTPQDKKMLYEVL